MLIRSVGRWLGRFVLLLVAVILAGWVLLPREGIGAVAPLDHSAFGDDLDRYLARSEAGHPGIIPGTEKRVYWAGEPGERTPLSVVYIHGFSASAPEIRPVPDNVATALGANLFYTRLTGHGLDGEALGKATGADWVRDTAEAMEIGRRIGERVLVMSTSTGGALATLAAADPEMRRGMAGLVFVSPNYVIRDGVIEAALRLPGVRYWGPVIFGAERSFVPHNEEHARYWTERYPSVAGISLFAVKNAAYTADHGSIDVPAFFIFSDEDRVVSPEATREVAAAWGGPVRMEVLTVPPGNDPDAHVITGDIRSPDLTGPVSDMVIDWASRL